MTQPIENHMLRTVLDDLPVGVIVQGPGAEIRYANQAALRLLGLTMDQLLGKTSFDPDWDVVRLDGSPFPGPEHPVPEAIRTRQSVLDVLMGVRRGKLGDRVWLLVSALPRLHASGAVRDVLCTFSDVTQEHAHVEASERSLKLAERRMQEQSELLAAMFRATSEGIVLHGPDGSIRMANRAAAKVLGLTIEQLTGRSPTDPRWGLVRTDGTPLPPKEIPSEVTRHTGAPIQMRLLGVDRPDRGRSWLAVTTDPVRPEADPPHHVVATFTDISRLREAQLALQRSEAQLARVTQAVPGVLFEIVRRPRDDSRPRPDAISKYEWSFSFLSGEVEELFGLPTEVVRRDPRALLAVLPPDQVRIVRDALQTAVLQGRSAEVEARLHRGEFDRSIRIHARPDATTESVRWTGFILDVTEARRLEDRLRTSQRLEAMSSLAAGVAHNFNNMLGAIVPNLDLALAKAAPHLQGPLRDALTAARSASELVRQLLFASRGEPEGHSATVDVHQVLSEVVNICRRTFDAGILLDVELSSSPLPSRGSATLIQQVALNLLINARDAVSDVDEPQIDLRAFAIEDQWVAFEVRDNGTGMTSEVRARLGEPFFTTKPPGQGTGLGLASVYGIVSDLGGRIDVDSTEGVGTRFQVRLPKVQPQITDFASTDPRTAELAGRRILLIDDEPLVRRAMSRMLRHRKVVVMEAGSGEDGLTMLDDTIDAVLLDLSMPGMPGDHVLRLMKVDRPHLPVAIVTGHVDDMPALEPADTVLRKPVDAQTLIRWLSSVLAKR
ncbi:MAG: ATP-binding protein [Myxococcota bacterium]